MTKTVKVRTTGGSVIITLPQEMVRKLDIRPGDTVELACTDNDITVSKKETE